MVFTRSQAHRLLTIPLRPGPDQVAESAVFGLPDELKGQVPLGLVVLKNNASLSGDALKADLIAQVRGWR